MEIIKEIESIKSELKREKNKTLEKRIRRIEKYLENTIEYKSNIRYIDLNRE